MRAKYPQLGLRYCSRLRRDQVTKTIRSIVSSNSILIRIHFQHILRPVRIVSSDSRATAHPYCLRIKTAAGTSGRRTTL
jgi:hypothetical protein